VSYKIENQEGDLLAQGLTYAEAELAREECPFSDALVFIDELEDQSYNQN